MKKNSDLLQLFFSFFCISMETRLNRILQKRRNCSNVPLKAVSCRLRNSSAMRMEKCPPWECPWKKPCCVTSSKLSSNE